MDGCNPTQPVAKEKMKTAMHAAAAGGFVDLIHILNIVSAFYGQVVTSPWGTLHTLQFINYDLSESEWWIMIGELIFV